MYLCIYVWEFREVVTLKLKNGVAEKSFEYSDLTKNYNEIKKMREKSV